MDATRVALAHLANLKTVRGSSGNASEGDEREENSRGVNEHIGVDSVRESWLFIGDEDIGDSAGQECIHPSFIP